MLLIGETQHDEAKLDGQKRIFKVCEGVSEDVSFPKASLRLDLGCVRRIIASNFEVTARAT